jgi:predicted dienelactone hydrolase
MSGRIGRTVWFLALGWMTLSCMAQRTVSVPREDGRETPLMIYDAATGDAAGGGKRCAPLALISHGAGGTERGYRYLAEAMAKMGYTAVVMGHPESGPGVLGANVRAQGLRKGVEEMVVNRDAESARLLDVGAALKWAEAGCKEQFKVLGKIPFRALLGHSMGAETVMLEAGAANRVGITSPPAGQKRFDAYVALSPEGPGIVFPDGAWRGVKVPVLMMTGTQDQAIKRPPEDRLIPFREMPGAKGGCQWVGVIDGARHMNFAGIGVEADNVTSLVDSTIESFLAGVRKGSCLLPATRAGMTLQAK